MQTFHYDMSPKKVRILVKKKKDNLTRLENSCAGVNNKITIVMRKFMSLFWILISIAFAIGSHFLSFFLTQLSWASSEKNNFSKFPSQTCIHLI